MDHLKKQMTREDVLQRFEATRKKKQEYITKLEKELKAEFKKRTGEEATIFEVW